MQCLRKARGERRRPRLNFEARLNLGIGLVSLHQLELRLKEGERKRLAIEQCLRGSRLVEMPGRFLGYVVLNPNWPLEENRRELKKRLLQQEGFIGIKFHPMWGEQPIDGDLYRPLWELAAEQAPLVLGHSWLGDEEPEGHGAGPVRVHGGAASRDQDHHGSWRRHVRLPRGVDLAGASAPVGRQGAIWTTSMVALAKVIECFRSR